MGKIIVDKKRVIIKKEGTRIYPTLVDLEITPKAEEQTFTHDGEYGYDVVTVKPIALKLQDKEAKIRKEQQVITADNDYDALSSVTINAPELQDKTVTPSEEEQQIYADDEFLALNSVKVNPIPEEYTKVEGTLTLVKNGEYDVKKYANVKTEIYESVKLEEKDINFFDYDGELLYSWSLEELADKTELPVLPEHEGLVCQGWNWTLEDLQEQKVPMVVGATYITDDEKTRIYIHLDEGRLTPTLGVAQSIANGIEIDWGDGNVEISNTIRTTSTSSTSNIKPINMKHEYLEPGDYIITLKPLNNCIIYLHGDYSSYSKVIWAENKSSSSYNVVYQVAIQEFYCGKNVSFNGYSLANCYSLKKITIPIGTEGLGKANSFANNYNLRFLVIPKGTDTVGNSLCSNCSKLEGISMPSEVVTIYDSMSTNCANISKIAFSRNTNKIPMSILNGSYKLKKIFFPKNIEEINTSAISNCRILENIIFEEGILITALPSNFAQSSSSLKSIDLPMGLKSIGNGAFNSCRSVTKMIIPPSVELLVAGCFAGMYGVKYYDFRQHLFVPTLENANAFQSRASDCIIVVPDGLYDEWILATNWTSLVSIIIKASEWEAQQ